ncbi:MAG: uroporphyrinogen-III synthase [Thalassotalea sp.]
MSKANLASKINVLVTRPEPNGSALVELLNQQQINAQPCALFSYQKNSSTSLCKSLLTDNSQSILIFVSVAAVEFAAQIVAVNTWQYRLVIAVGKATQQALKNIGVVALSPTRQDSEGVLALPELADVRQQPVVLIRGDDGRELLFNALKAKGAIVRYGQSYQRKWRQPTPNEIDYWRESAINCIVITSVSLLENMVNLLVRPENYWQKSCCWVVASARIANRAKQLELSHVLTAQGADNQRLLTAIIEMEKQDDRQ